MFSVNVQYGLTCRHFKGDSARRSAAVRRPCHSGSPNTCWIIKVVRDRLCTFLGLRTLSLAQEPDGRSYAPAIVRVHGDGVSNPLHNDNIMRDSSDSGLLVSRLRFQFSCVTCIQECNADGELLHYRRRWEPSHEQFKVQEGLRYRDDVVNGAELCQFRPETGNIYIIDPTNLHAIRAVKGRNRVTLGFFFGFFDADFRDPIYWS
jgi:hypothetical protein